jgi:flagellar biosynthesis protein
MPPPDSRPAPPPNRPATAPAADPRRNAVALAYGAGESAPRVVAKGRGLIADEIIARARDAGVYVHESPELVSLLMQVDLDERIPPQLYQAVAELLAWLYRLDRGLLPAVQAVEAAGPSE